MWILIYFLGRPRPPLRQIGQQQQQSQDTLFVQQTSTQSGQVQVLYLPLKLTADLLVTVVRLLLLLLTNIHKCIGKWWCGWLWWALCALCAEPAVADAVAAAAHAPKCSSKGWWSALWWEVAAAAPATFGPTLWWWWWWWWERWQGIAAEVWDEGGFAAAVAAVIAATAAAGDNKGWCNGLVCEWCDVEVALFIKLVFGTAALLITAACVVKWCNKFGKLPVGYGRPKLG